MRPLIIPKDIQKYWQQTLDLDETISEIQNNYKTLSKGYPDVSVVIPAYNEEKSILQTLRSICHNVTSYFVEIIVVDNNSTDKTAKLVEACGIACVSERKQGITFARNCGITHAKGKYIINADADTIYPAFWIQELIQPLAQNETVALTYGTFSFLPTGNIKRITYFFYEHFADLSRKLNKHIKDEAVNVYGFNSAFRKHQALQVDGYNHPPGSNEDGYLALKLRNNGFGKLVFAKKALVWTTDRRIHIDGGLWKGTSKRLRRIIGVR
jgi:glycosyltransferase involved in cell wall biosynthesis